MRPAGLARRTDHSATRPGTALHHDALSIFSAGSARLHTDNARPDPAIFCVAVSAIAAIRHDRFFIAPDCTASLPRPVARIAKSDSRKPGAAIAVDRSPGRARFSPRTGTHRLEGSSKVFVPARPGTVLRHGLGASMPDGTPSPCRTGPTSRATSAGSPIAPIRRNTNPVMGLQYNNGRSTPDPSGHSVSRRDPGAGPLVSGPDRSSGFCHSFVGTLIDMRQQPGRRHGRITVEPGLPLLQ